jgi:hypothetical protein
MVNCQGRTRTIHASPDTFAKYTWRSFGEDLDSTETVLDTRMTELVAIGTEGGQCQ